MTEETLVQFLEASGYRYWDQVNIQHEGLTKHYRKSLNGVNLDVSFHWANQGGESFWIARLRSHFQLYPHSGLMQPVLFMEVADITDRTIAHLGIYEDRLCAAILQQIKLPPL